MSAWGKAVSLVLVNLILVVALLTPSVTLAQITSSYGRGYYGTDSDINYCAFNLTMYSPNNQTAYVNTMLLNFNITWTTYPIFPFPMAPPLNGHYAYSIDDGPFVSLAATPSPSDRFYATPQNNFTINPSFSYSVDISNLENGYHNIVIYASLYNERFYPPHYLFFNITTSPYVFSVGEPPASPTVLPTASPTASPMPSSAIGTLISPLTIPIVAIVIAVVLVVVSFLLYRRQRKPKASEQILKEVAKI